MATTTATSARNDHMAEYCEDETCMRLPCVMYKRGYQEGERRGYQRGYADGYTAGYADGFGAGMAAGYQAGFAAGVASAGNG